MPRATINIGDATGQAATGAVWKFARGYVPGETNEGLVEQREGSPARLPDYDDSGWAVCYNLPDRVSHGFSFVWYRTTITIPESVAGHATGGMRVQFETCVDDYGEIWIDGECNRDRATVQGFNVPQRVQVTDNAQPGNRHTIAILAVNGAAGRTRGHRVRALRQPGIRVDGSVASFDSGSRLPASCVPTLALRGYALCHCERPSTGSGRAAMFCPTGTGCSIEIATSLDALGMTGRSSQ